MLLFRILSCDGQVLQSMLIRDLTRNKEIVSAKGATNPIDESNPHAVVINILHFTDVTPEGSGSLPKRKRHAKTRR
jgi:hypothetical protein